jgi:hypothetical protein
MLGKSTVWSLLIMIGRRVETAVVALGRRGVKGPSSKNETNSLSSIVSENDSLTVSEVPICYAPTARDDEFDACDVIDRRRRSRRSVVIKLNERSDGQKPKWIVENIHIVSMNATGRL